MTQLEIPVDRVHIESCKLGAKYCRKTLEKGGVSIFVHKTLKFANISLDDYCKDQDMETCALKLESTFSNICILSLYRAPSGTFDQFSISMLHSPKTEFILCGDINVNCLVDSNRKQNLDLLLLSIQYHYFSNKRSK